MRLLRLERFEVEKKDNTGTKVAVATLPIAGDIREIALYTTAPQLAEMLLEQVAKGK